MLRGSRHLGKILGYSFSPIKVPTSRCLDLSRRVGRGDIWRRQWELLENRVYNKSNGCSATGALAPGPDHQQPTKEVKNKLEKCRRRQSWTNENNYAGSVMDGLRQIRRNIRRTRPKFESGTSQIQVRSINL
jgi:hypothetical protein